MSKSPLKLQILMVLYWWLWLPTVNCSTLIGWNCHVTSKNQSKCNFNEDFSLGQCNDWSSQIVL